MTEKFAEHEGVVGFGMVAMYTNVFVHVKCDNVSESAKMKVQKCCDSSPHFLKRTTVFLLSPSESVLGTWVLVMNRLEAQGRMDALVLGRSP